MYLTLDTVRSDFVGWRRDDLHLRLTSHDEPRFNLGICITDMVSLKCLRAIMLRTLRWYFALTQLIIT